MKIKHYIYTFIATICLYSCEKVVDLNLDTIEPRLVIDASLSANGSSSASGCFAILTKTQNFNSPGMPELVSDATVTLTDNTTSITTALTFDSGSGRYRTPIAIITGRSYTMTVIYEGATYSATETVPDAVPIDELYFIRIKMGKEDDPYMMPTIVFMDPPIERNYYKCILYVNDRRMSTVYLNDDEYKNGKRFPWSLFFDSSDNNDDELKIGDKVRVEMSSLAYGSYFYFQTLTSVAAGGGTNPISNFSGDVLGVLKAYADSSIEEVISESNIEDK